MSDISISSKLGVSIFKPYVFSAKQCDLGEGPLWHSKRNSLFWVDILNNTVYEKEFDSKKDDYDNKWTIPYICTAVAEHREYSDKLYILTNHSFGILCLKTSQYTPIIKLSIPDEFRTNDGSVAPDGSFWFGTMQNTPDARKGEVYSLSPKSQLIKQLEDVGIPNTFCWSKTGETFFLSDSFRQKLFSYSFDNSVIDESSMEAIIDLSTSNATPDGGAMDVNNQLWNAHWDGACVVCYDETGAVLQRIEMPVPKPTSCCFGGPENKHLFITSAKENMSDEEIKQFPLSGLVFIVELQVAGSAVNPFYMELNEC